MVTDGQRITVLLVTEHELAFVVGTPQTVGRVSANQCCPLGFVAPSLAAFNQTITIEHRMHRAYRRWLKHRELLQQRVADLARTPGRVLLLDA